MRKHGPAGAFLRRKMRRKRGRTQTEWRQGPGCERGATFERSENGGASTLPPVGATTGQPGFAAGEMRPNGSKGRGFAVGAPARRSRDGNGKTAVRGGEAMAAKRTTAQGGFAQRNAAPAFARQTQKAGPVTVRAVSPQVKCDRTGARAGAGTEAACGKRGRPPLSRG